MDNCRHVLINQSGQQLPLDGTDGVILLRGVDGRYAPPIHHLDDPAVGRDGTVLRDVWFGPRDVTLPLAIDNAEGLSNIRTMMRRFNPRNGDARLRFESSEGSRDLVGRVVQLSAPDDRRPGKLMAVLTFRAHDPFWRDSSSQVLFFNIGPDDFFPVPPMAVYVGQVAASANINNTGDVEAWPVWTIAGPAEKPIFTRGDDVLELDYDVEEGEVVTIDTRPGRKTVISSDEGSIYKHLTSESKLWSLRPGVQTINILLPESDEHSSLTLSYRRRYFTP